jgi:hypothetical protein
MRSQFYFPSRPSNSRSCANPDPRVLALQMTHTNDLVSLALTNSALYTLAVPHIYARFDIVWPEGQTDMTESKSVDALTFGLSTLTLGSAFSRITRKLFYPGASPLNRFRDSKYAQYTRKFSLGNGPKEWVAEYMLTKESGKMLGTLVALAISRMINLETFVWDMPTGVLSDIFMALAMLGERTDDGECKLDRVWVRWHDNNGGLEASSSPNDALHGLGTSLPPGSILTPIGIHLPANASHPTPRPPISYAEHNVEYPTFSVLPPVKSLTVVDIDELSYLDELAVLVERSKDRLQELRIGIAPQAAHKDFVQTWDGPGLRQVDHKARWPGESVIGERRLGGVLGVLVAKVYDIKKRSSRHKEKHEAAKAAIPIPTTNVPAGYDTASSALIAGANLTDPTMTTGAGQSSKYASPPKAKSSTKQSSSRRKRLDGKLKLQTLGLERISLSMHVCRYAFDWSVLTSLTILDCLQHENLWKMLRKQFQPTPLPALGFGISTSSAAPPPPVPNAPMQYHLALKHLHTDVTSPALVAFLKETLAPNSLEVLFLQDRRRPKGPPQVTIKQLFAGPLKRHRASLKKLLLDSSGRWAQVGATVGPGAGAASVQDPSRWRNWVLPTDMLLYITSGRMAALTELSVALDHKDWVCFMCLFWSRLPLSLALSLFFFFFFFFFLSLS